MQRIHRRAHALIWLFLAFVLPLILVFAVFIRDRTTSPPVALEISPQKSGAVK